jgi:RHS repeat-associated protein
VLSYGYGNNAWGNFSTFYHNGATSSSPAALNRINYRGYYYDKDLSLYYVGSRYYDANTGRWISADKYASTGQGFTGFNMYAYCNNNPVMAVDSSGELISQTKKMKRIPLTKSLGKSSLGQGVIALKNIIKAFAERKAIKYEGINRSYFFCVVFIIRTGNYFT